MPRKTRRCNLSVDELTTTSHGCGPLAGRRSLALIQRCLPSAPRTRPNHSKCGRCCEPKTERGKRTLPLDDGLVAALRSLRARQSEERLRAGSAYSGPCGDCGGAHVVVNELGQPYVPEYMSDRFQRLSRAAGLPQIRLHDARHTCGTLMHLRGVPTAVISKWLGHATAAFTMNVYVHSQDDALAAAGALYATVIRSSQSG